MRHARHDPALTASENNEQFKHQINRKGQKYIIIIYDGPNVAAREASFVSNVELGDVVQVCEAVAKQIKSNRAN